MMNKFYPLALAAALGIGAFAVPGGGASAMTIPAIQQTATDGMITDGNPLLQEVAKRRSWNKNRDGNRYKSRRGAYRHYYGGYYYRTPWWALALPVVGLNVIVYHDRNWCRKRGYYRNSTWVSRGQRHRCR